jgi:hypothetical protein
MNMHTTIELLLETVFSVRSVPKSYLEDNWGDPAWELSVVSWKLASEEKTRRAVWNGRQPGSCQLRAEFCKWVCEEMALLFSWQWVDREFCTGGCEDRTWAREPEDSSLLEAFTRELLMKTQQAGKRLSVCCGDLWIVEIAIAL